MSRPCAHEPLIPDECIYCAWMVSDNARGHDKRQQWGEDESHVIKRSTASAPVSVARAIPRSCKFLGAPTGETATCPSCRGGVQLKLFSCQIHGSCTPGKAAPEIACCTGCKQYQGRD